MQQLGVLDDLLPHEEPGSSAGFVTPGFSILASFFAKPVRTSFRICYMQYCTLHIITGCNTAYNHCCGCCKLRSGLTSSVLHNCGFAHASVHDTCCPVSPMLQCTRHVCADIPQSSRDKTMLPQSRSVQRCFI